MTSEEYNSFLGVEADSPITLLPASTPNVISCVYVVVVYNNCIVNGQRFTTLAFPSLRRCFTLPCLSVGISGCPVISSTYTIIDTPSNMI